MSKSHIDIQGVGSNSTRMGVSTGILCDIDDVMTSASLVKGVDFASKAAGVFELMQLSDMCSTVESVLSDLGYEDASVFGVGFSALTASLGKRIRAGLSESDSNQVTRLADNLMRKKRLLEESANAGHN